VCTLSAEQRERERCTISAEQKGVHLSADFCREVYTFLQISAESREVCAPFRRFLQSREVYTFLQRGIRFLQSREVYTFLQRGIYLSAEQRGVHLSAERYIPFCRNCRNLKFLQFMQEGAPLCINLRFMRFLQKVKA
jgi:hypothetical protein